MCLIFDPNGHKYSSIDLFDKTDWLSASRISGMFKKPFDSEKVALRSSQKKTSKWYGISPKDILEYWRLENLRSTDLGTGYHEKEEAKLLGLTHVFRYGKDLPIIRSIWENGVKVAPNQKLVDGIYPEHLTFLKWVGICGQFDEIIVADGVVYVDDHKSNKDLMKPPFVNWEGVTEKLLPPLMHLDACKIVECSIQLSLGMYMVLRHNPQLKAGDMTINHITFEIESEDRFRYPIMRRDENGEPIVKNIEKIKVPYLKREVEIIIEHIKNKRNV